MSLKDQLKKKRPKSIEKLRKSVSQSKQRIEKEGKENKEKENIKSLESFVNEKMGAIKIELENEMKSRIADIKDSVEKQTGVFDKLTKIKGEQGDKPKVGVDFEQPKNGETPIKGVDYFIPSEIKQFKKEITPTKGKDYSDGKKGDTPIKGIDYFDGVDADEENVLEKVLKKVPKLDLSGIITDIKELKKRKQKPEEIVRSLEALKGKEKLDYFALKNLPDIPQDGKRRTLHRGGQGLAVFAHDLSSQTDGSTKTFTIPVHTRALSLTGSDFPFTYRLTTDFTTSGTTLTITSSPDAPSQNATLWFVYAK